MTSSESKPWQHSNKRVSRAASAGSPGVATGRERGSHVAPEYRDLSKRDIEELLALRTWANAHGHNSLGKHARHEIQRRGHQ